MALADWITDFHGRSANSTSERGHMESREIADMTRLDVGGRPHRIQVFQDFLRADAPHEGEAEWIPSPHLRFLVDGKYPAQEQKRDRCRIVIPEEGIVVQLDPADLP